MSPDRPLSSISSKLPIYGRTCCSYGLAQSTLSYREADNSILCRVFGDGVLVLTRPGAVLHFTSFNPPRCSFSTGQGPPAHVRSRDVQDLETAPTQDSSMRHFRGPINIIKFYALMHPILGQRDLSSFPTLSHTSTSNIRLMRFDDNFKKLQFGTALSLQSQAVSLFTSCASLDFPHGVLISVKLPIQRIAAPDSL